MVDDPPANFDASAPLYHGTRAELLADAHVDGVGGVAHFSPNLDDAIWAAELAQGEGAPRVYLVAPRGPVDNAADAPDYVRPRHPAMSWRTRGPLVVLREVTQWSHYHGTRADLRPGDLIAPGHAANFGPAPRLANFVYFTRTLDASIWGAELARGAGPGRIYRVEPTGPFEDDPNLTNARFRGNPTKSFRSRAPLRVEGEVTGWSGHPPEMIRAMKESLARLERAGVTPDDD
jgi:rifampin ADP-ribosylating transferase